MIPPSPAAVSAARREPNYGLIANAKTFKTPTVAQNSSLYGSQAVGVKARSLIIPIWEIP